MSRVTGEQLASPVVDLIEYHVNDASLLSFGSVRFRVRNHWRKALALNDYLSESRHKKIKVSQRDWQVHETLGLHRDLIQMREEGGSCVPLNPVANEPSRRYLGTESMGIVMRLCQFNLLLPLTEPVGRVFWRSLHLLSLAFTCPCYLVHREHVHPHEVTLNPRSISTIGYPPVSDKRSLPPRHVLRRIILFALTTRFVEASQPKAFSKPGTKVPR